MASLSNYLKQQYASALESELAGLKNAYDQNTATLDRTAQEIPQQYETQRNTVAATNALEKQAFDERANAMGLNTGTSGQAQLAKSSVYQRDLANLGAAEAGALADLDLKRATLKANYENEMARAKAANEAALNQALYAETVRQEQAAAAAAAAAAKAAPVVVGGGGYTAPAPNITTVKAHESAAGTGTTSFSNVKRTISGKLAAGDVSGAEKLVNSIVNSISPAQIEDLRMMGFDIK